MLEPKAKLTRCVVQAGRTCSFFFSSGYEWYEVTKRRRSLWATLAIVVLMTSGCVIIPAESEPGTPIQGRSSLNSKSGSGDVVYVPFMVGIQILGNDQSAGGSIPFAADDVSAAANDNAQHNNGHDRVHRHESGENSRSRFAALGEEWPPQPKSMRDIVFNSTEELQNRIAERRANSQVALRDDRVHEVLGERFVYIDTEVLARKGNMGRTDVLNTYFSHTFNHTVQVTVEQNQVTDILTLDAAEYQPPLAPEEVTEAITIARAYFGARSISRVAELEGFTILTFPGQDGGAFHTNRIGYVSFSPDADSNPEFVAWVDLTNQVVVESREE